MFELNFRDERYLPFEGAGTISTWSIELPPDTNAFDLSTITDVVLRISYTARDGGTDLRNQARDALHLRRWPVATLDAPSPEPAPGQFQRLFSLRHEFAVEWFQFLQGGGAQPMGFDLTPERFPYQLRGQTITVQQLDIFWVSKGDAGAHPDSLTLTRPDGTMLTRPAGTGGGTDWDLAPLPHVTVSPIGAPLNAGTSYTWRLGLGGGAHVSADQVEDILVVCTFSV
jgi:hypothetical protein